MWAAAGNLSVHCDSASVEKSLEFLRKTAVDRLRFEHTFRHNQGIMMVSTPALVYPARVSSSAEYAHGRAPRLFTADDGSIDVRATMDVLVKALPGPETLTVASRLAVLD